MFSASGTLGMFTASGIFSAVLGMFSVDLFLSRAFLGTFLEIAVGIVGGII
jgi:hypothetical protein